MSYRKNIRLGRYDYRTPGAYVITIVVEQRECCLSTISENQVCRTEFGDAVVSAWDWLSQEYDYVRPDDLVVMPNHIHGILWIVDEGEIKDQEIRKTDRLPLGKIVAAFKTITTKEINRKRNTPGRRFWQLDFYDHAIRDERDLAAARDYIANNPAQWGDDEENLNRGL